MAKRKKPAAEPAPEPAPEDAEPWLEELDADGEPELPGLSTNPNDRYLYLRLGEGEDPSSQLDAVFAYWQKRGRKQGMPAGIMTGNWVVTLPGGERFCGFNITRYTSRRDETDEQQVPLVVAALACFREFATATGRLVGEIVEGMVFACDDGRRIPLSECTYRELTMEDWGDDEEEPSCE